MNNEVEVYGNVFNTLGLPEGLVPFSYQMDIHTEDVIRGRNLQQGQVVLLEETCMRQNPKQHEEHMLNGDLTCDDYSCPRAKETSQWCMVTDLERRGDLMSFVGVYADGVKRSRTYNVSFFWLVKKDL